MSVTKSEYRQIIRWVLIGVGSFFLYNYFNNKIAKVFPQEEAQLIVGVLLLFISAYYFNLNKYSG